MLLVIIAWIPEGPRLTVMPDTVIAGPPGIRVLLPVMHCDAELGVKG